MSDENKESEYEIEYEIESEYWACPECEAELEFINGEYYCLLCDETFSREQIEEI